MSSLRPVVRSAIESFLKSQDESETPSDILRIVQEEALLMKETLDLCSCLERDPFEHFMDIRPQVKRLKRILKVSSCERQRGGSHWAFIEATVRFEEQGSTADAFSLKFRYQRQRDERPEGKVGAHVWYSIDFCPPKGPSESLLITQVWAADEFPCTSHPATSIHSGEDEDGWSDIETDDEQNNAIAASEQENDETKEGNSSKRQKVQDDEEPTRGDENKVDCDKFMASIDPDVLQRFLVFSKATPMSDIDAFFLLMTFPYYEHEWDLVGYILDDVFGVGDESESDENH